MARRRATTTESPPLKLDEKLVLNQWMLSLFEVSSFDTLTENLKALELEGLGKKNVRRFFHQMRLLWEYERFPGDTLLGYDQTINKHSRRLSEKRVEQLRWKQDLNTKDQEYDLIYVNGDNNLENLRRGGQTWRVRLIEEEFGRLMFDVEDV